MLRFLLLAVYLLPRADWASDAPPVILGQGEQRMLREPDLSRFSVGSPAVRAHSLPARGGLLLKGISPGITDLWVWKHDGSSEHRTVSVEKADSSWVAAPLERALSHLEETEVLMTSEGVVLRGEVSAPAEAAQIRALSDAYPKEVHDETELSEDYLKASETRLDAWIQSTPYASTLKLERQGRSLFVRGSLSRPEQLAQATRQIRRMAPLATVELDCLPDASPTVYFRIFLLELRKNRFHTLGLGWPALQDGAFRVSTSGIQDALSLDLTLNALEGEGSARILSNPELVVRAPGEAELFAGGEIPVQMKSHFYSSVTWKTYGLTLRLKVSQSSGERVRLEIFTEVSHLDPSIAQDGIPGIQANRMKTEVDARYGTPLLLSGLLEQGMRQELKGLPLLRAIPVLGKLFGSEDFQEDRSELVAILLPASAPPANPLERLSPRGPAPPPREWVSPEQERALRSAREWPWNALR